MRRPSIAEAAGLLRHRTALLDDGYTDRGIREGVACGVLHRVRRGWYVRAESWAELWPEGKHLLHVLAVDRDARGDGHVFSHASAAVVHGFPLYRFVPRRVDLVTGSPRRHSAPDILRHERPLAHDDVVVDGLRVTSSVRTVVDLAASLTLEAAVSVADACLRDAAVTGFVQDPELAGRWRESARSQLAALRGRPGVRQGRRVVEFADGRAQLPGESVSRLQLHRLGVRVTDLQVRISAVNGGAYYPDFELGEIASYGEFDGEGKYTAAAMRSGRTLEQVLLEEKRREDWIRGTTGWRMLRWGDKQIATPDALGRHLASFGVRTRR